MVIAIANFVWVAGEIRFEGIALGSAAAIIIYHLMNALSHLFGTSVEAASPASAPAGTELEGQAYGNYRNTCDDSNKCETLENTGK